MKTLKKVFVSLMAVVVLATSVSGAAFAADSPTMKNFSKTTVTVSGTSVKYTGSYRKPIIVVTDGNVLLREGVDYNTNVGNGFKHSGTYTIKITGKGHYTGTKTVKFTIKGKDVKVTAKAKTSSVKAKDLKKKSKKIKITVTKAKSFKGAVTYKVVKGSSKYITVSKKGYVTLKKGAKKGTYKVRVYVAGYKGYNPQTKTVTIKVK
ncbi:MAG: hypothetical protein ACI4S2_12955 [Lachnospiraceae bacterium]